MGDDSFGLSALVFRPPLIDGPFRLRLGRASSINGRAIVEAARKTAITAARGRRNFNVRFFPGSGAVNFELRALFQGAGSFFPVVSSPLIVLTFDCELKCMLYKFCYYRFKRVTQYIEKMKNGFLEKIRISFKNEFSSDKTETVLIEYRVKRGISVSNIYYMLDLF